MILQSEPTKKWPPPKRYIYINRLGMKCNAWEICQKCSKCSCIFHNLSSGSFVSLICDTGSFFFNFFSKVFMNSIINYQTESTVRFFGLTSCYSVLFIWYILYIYLISMALLNTPRCVAWMEMDDGVWTRLHTDWRWVYIVDRDTQTLAHRQRPLYDNICMAKFTSFLMEY